MKFRGRFLFSDTCGKIYAKRSDVVRDGRMNHGHVVECGAVAPLLIRDAGKETLFSTSIRALLVSHAADSPVAARANASTLKPRYLLRHGGDLP